MTTSVALNHAHRGATGVLAALAIAVLPASAALASQGPGTGPGGAGAMTQLAMAVIVYGVSGLLVAVGLIGAVRRR